jgi:hypothetical protein
MKFSEVVRLLEKNGFRLFKEKARFATTRRPGTQDWFGSISTGQRKFHPAHVMLFLRQPESNATNDD